MLLETLQNLVRAGGDALQMVCGLPVTAPHISLVRQGSLTFPGLGELRIRNGSVQRVHLGCDTSLVGLLAERAGGDGARSGIEVLAGCLLDRLLDEMEGRNPRGEVANLAVAPLTLHTRGLRTFGFRLETPAGQLFLLAEVPSKAELEIAKNSDFMAGMISTYLPRDWRQRSGFTARTVVDSVLVFLRKVEQDIYLEVPSGDASVVHTGFLLGSGTLDGRRALKICVDLQDSDVGAPDPGDTVRAQVGVEERSLEFGMPYLGSGVHEVAGAELPCAWFGVPDEMSVVQRRRAFRMPLPDSIEVQLECGDSLRDGSPWADEEPVIVHARGRLLDLSFSGARIVLTEHDEAVDLAAGRRVRCHLRFPDQTRPLSVGAVIRRSTFGLADRNEWREELGLEFVVAGDTDRDTLIRIRDYVLSLQRERLAHRIHVAGPRR